MRYYIILFGKDNRVIEILTYDNQEARDEIYSKWNRDYDSLPYIDCYGIQKLDQVV
jgi:hypothetical protein